MLVLFFRFKWLIYLYFIGNKLRIEIDLWGHADTQLTTIVKFPWSNSQLICDCISLTYQASSRCGMFLDSVEGSTDLLYRSAPMQTVFIVIIFDIEYEYFSNLKRQILPTYSVFTYINYSCPLIIFILYLQITFAGVCPSWIQHGYVQQNFWLLVLCLVFP